MWNFAILKNEKSDNRGDILGQMLRRGLESIRHRGPDGSNIWVSADSSVGFGHVRLAIVDLDTGSQPMSIEDGTTIIFNGEIYNYLDPWEELGPNFCLLLPLIQKSYCVLSNGGALIALIICEVCSLSYMGCCDG